MTVKELIAALGKMPQDAHVYLDESVNCITEDYQPEVIQVDEFMLKTHDWNNRFVRHKPVDGELVVML